MADVSFSSFLCAKEKDNQKHLPFYPNRAQTTMYRAFAVGYMFANMYPTCTLSPLAYISIPLLDIYATLFIPVSPMLHSDIC